MARSYPSVDFRPSMGDDMPDKETLERAQQDKREGKSASTQAGEFVREEMHHIREGKHGAASTEQAIAIGLSKARRAGVKLPRRGASAKSAKAGASRRKSGRPSVRRSRATRKALKRQPHTAASPRALAKHARSTARRRGATARSASARKAVRTKGAALRKAAARKGARTRARKR